MSFSEATALSRGPDGYEGKIHDGWDITGNTSGGYLMSLFARAALLETGRPDIISVSAHFLSPGQAGPISATASTIKDGRRFATTQVGLSGGGKQLLTGTVITGDLTEGVGPELVSVQAPDMPPPSDCVLTVPGDVLPPPFVDKIEQRLHPDDTPGSKFAPGNGGPRIRGWFRLHDDEPIESLATVLATDCLPPTVFNTDLTIGWVPTVQMTVHLRSRPTTKWLLVDTVSNFIKNGSFEVDAAIYDEHGELVAQSRQLQLIAQG